MSNKNKRDFIRARGQAMAEFGLILPLLLLVVVGLLEVGRAIFITSSVNSASREAVRFASAFGDVNPATDGVPYNNCAEIRNVARRTAFLIDLADDDIVISYDTGPNADGTIPAAYDVCDDTTDGTDDGIDEDVIMDCGDRIVVTVTTAYAPMVGIIPMDPRPLESSSARTYYGPIELSDEFRTECNE